jgi:hypothetical protein
LFERVSRASDLGALRVLLIAPNLKRKKKKKNKFKVTVNTVKCVNMTYKYLISTNIIFYTTKKSFTVHRKIFSVCPVRFRFLQAKRPSFGKNRYKGNSAEALLVKTCHARYDC